MAERSYVTGAIAIGIVAAALRVSTAPAPSTAPPQSSLTSIGSTHGRSAITTAKNPLDQIQWSTEMSNNPENLGKLTAQKELSETIGDFYSPLLTSSPTSDSQAGEQSDTLEVMIAIEPDPVHTHLALLFDRDIDALVEALQKSGWQYQSNWLPWSPVFSASDGGRFVDQQQQHLFLAGREQYPGVLLFRSDQPRQTPNPPVTTDVPADEKPAPHRRPLAVFVVGNSPTGGIDHIQFEEALSQIKTLAPRQTALNILGPTFSGSGPSLRNLLLGVRVSNPNLKTIKIASGSISDPRCEDMLPNGKAVGDACTTDQLPGTTFVSFGIDKDWRAAQIVAFLREQGRFNYEDIAELNEDQSSYGAPISVMKPTITPVPDTGKYLHLFFPRNISHLRNAYQKSNIFGFGASTQGAGNVTLNLNFDEGGEDDDAIPNFAPRQMPVSQDGVMRQITGFIEQRHIKVVILSATDVLDQLFVAEILARQAPNTLVLINQSDNLFLRTNTTNNFGNMYFVSPFPLITDSQLWSHPIDAEKNARFFPSDISQGLYAAVQYLNPPPVRDLPGYGSPLESTNRPPLWLSAVGHGAFWPVALLNGPGRSSINLPALPSQGSPAGIFKIETPPLSQNLVLLLLCLIALLHTAKCFDIPAFQNLAFRYNINDPAARVPKLSLQFSMTILFSILLQLCISPSHPASLAMLAFYTGRVAICAAAVYLAYSLALPLLLRLKPGYSIGVFLESRQARLVKLPALLVAIALISWGTYALWQALWTWLAGPSGFSDFFRYRAAYPLRGVSPVFPLSLSIAALFVYFYNHLDRIAFTKNLAPLLPTAVEGLPNCPSDSSVQSVTSLLAWPPSLRTIRKKVSWLVFIVALVLVWIKPLHLRPRMFEGPHLQRSLGLAMFLIVVAILWELAMATMIWQRLKVHCLDHLESSTLRRGFSTVSGITWSSLWIIRGNPFARYRSITRLLEQATRDVLQEEVSPPGEDGPTLKKTMDTLFTDIADHPTPQQIVTAFGPVQQQIAIVAGKILEQLKTAWNKEEHRITAPDAITGDEKNVGSVCTPADKPIEPLQRLQEEWVALVYIHYIRMVLLQIRSRLLGAAMLYLFLVWAGTSYPYLNRHVLLIALSALLGILSFAIISIYASINRDAILSRATNHIPGHLDLDFYLKIASFVGVPLIGFIASQFPEINGFLFSWIEPSMTAFK